MHAIVSENNCDYIDIDDARAEYYALHWREGRGRECGGERETRVCASERERVSVSRALRLRKKKKECIIIASNIIITNNIINVPFFPWSRLPDSGFYASRFNHAAFFFSTFFGSLFIFSFSLEFPFRATAPSSRHPTMTETHPLCSVSFYFLRVTRLYVSSIPPLN